MWVCGGVCVCVHGCGGGVCVGVCVSATARALGVQRPTRVCARTCVHTVSGAGHRRPSGPLARERAGRGTGHSARAPASRWSDPGEALRWQGWQGSLGAASLQPEGLQLPLPPPGVGEPGGTTLPGPPTQQGLSHRQNSGFTAGSHGPEDKQWTEGLGGSQVRGVLTGGRAELLPRPMLPQEQADSLQAPPPTPGPTTGAPPAPAALGQAALPHCCLLSVPLPDQTHKPTWRQTSAPRG